MKYRHINKILREIGKIANNPVCGFLMQKEDKNEPANKLSDFLTDKLNEQSKPQTETNNEEIDDEEVYYRQLDMHNKEELKKKKTFDFLNYQKKIENY